MHQTASIVYLYVLSPKFTSRWRPVVRPQPQRSFWYAYMYACLSLFGTDYLYITYIYRLPSWEPAGFHFTHVRLSSNIATAAVAPPEVQSPCSGDEGHRMNRRDNSDGDGPWRDEAQFITPAVCLVFASETMPVSDPVLRVLQTPESIVHHVSDRGVGRCGARFAQLERRPSRRLQTRH